MTDRKAVRAIVLTPDNKILLLRIKLPGVGPFWITPGGGIEPHETIQQALRRELCEEIGLTDFEIGPVVWLRQHTFNWKGERFRQHETYHIVRAEHFEPRISDQVENAVLDEFRWWNISDLPHAIERLTPLSLWNIVDSYLSSGPPIGPLQLEILED